MLFRYGSAEKLEELGRAEAKSPPSPLVRGIMFYKSPDFRLLSLKSVAGMQLDLTFAAGKLGRAEKGTFATEEDLEQLPIQESLITGCLLYSIIRFMKFDICVSLQLYLIYQMDLKGRVR